MKRIRFSTQLLPAPLWSRIMAYIIDALIISFFITAPFQKYFGDLIPQNLSFKQLFNYFMTASFDLKNLFIAILSLMVITVLYWALLEWKLGQSIGKLVMNITVTSTKKEKLNFGQSIVRNLSKVSTVLLFLDVLYMIIKKQHQRWLEELSNTEVLYKTEKVII